MASCRWRGGATVEHLPEHLEHVGLDEPHDHGRAHEAPLVSLSTNICFLLTEYHSGLIESSVIMGSFTVVPDATMLGSRNACLLGSLLLLLLTCWSPLDAQRPGTTPPR